MKYYNVENYVRYKHDLEDTIKRMKRDGEIVYSDTEGTVDYTQMFDSSIIKMWMPLCEALARKFATSQQASGVMDITDLISCGHLGLCKAVAMFFNSIFLSIDAGTREDDDLFLQIEDKSEPYNQVFLNMYLTSLLKQHLTDKEFHVLRLSYGLDCDKHSAKQIAEHLDIEGTGAYVRVSQLKKQAVDKLIENVDHSQVLDYL